MYNFLNENNIYMTRFNDIDSYAFSLSPNISLFNNVINLSNQNNFYCDSQILSILNNNYNFSNIKEYPYLFHNCTKGSVGRENKYWGKYNLNTINEVYNFIDNIDKESIKINDNGIIYYYMDTITS